MPALSEYANVWDTALAILRAKGFQVWRNDELDVFCAERDGWDFMSESLCGLLGLVAIFEFHSPTEYREYWWREDDARSFMDLPPKPEREFRPVYRKSGPGD